VGRLGEFGGRRRIGAEQQQSAARWQPREEGELPPHRREVGVDVGVVELYVRDDRYLREVVEELGALVPVRAVVFVSFYHK